MFHSRLFVHPELLQDRGGLRRGTQASDVLLLNEHKCADCLI